MSGYVHQPHSFLTPLPAAARPATLLTPSCLRLPLPVLIAVKAMCKERVRQAGLSSTKEKRIGIKLFLSLTTQRAVTEKNEPDSSFKLLRERTRNRKQLLSRKYEVYTKKSFTILSMVRAEQVAEVGCAAFSCGDTEEPQGHPEMPDITSAALL